MARKLIAIDAGKFACKAATYNSNGTEKIIAFRSKLEETQRAEAQGQSFIVNYGGKKFLVGEQATEASVSGKTTKAEELHKVCAYTALGLLANTDDEIVVALGCPLSIYENSVQRKAFKDYMFPMGQTIDITVNNVTKHLKVKSCMIFPESSGIIHLEPEKYGGDDIGVLDLGGLNLNAVVYSNQMPILQTLFCENLGGNVFTTELKNALSQNYGEDIPDWMMTSILRQGYIVDNMSSNGILTGSREFISNFKEKHLDNILNICQKHNWNLRFTKLVFVGGSSELFREEIKKKLPAAVIVEQPEFANVRGFLKAITE